MRTMPPELSVGAVQRRVARVAKEVLDASSVKVHLVDPAARRLWRRRADGTVLSSDARADQWPARALRSTAPLAASLSGTGDYRHFLFAPVTVTDADTAQAAEQIARDAITADDDVSPT